MESWNSATSRLVGQWSTHEKYGPLFIYKGPSLTGIYSLAPVFGGDGLLYGHYYYGSKTLGFEDGTDFSKALTSLGEPSINNYLKSQIYRDDIISAVFTGLLSILIFNLEK